MFFLCTVVCFLLETDMFDGSMNLYCSFRMDEMMKGQRGWRELAELGEKGPKFAGMLESIIWSPKGGDADKLGDGWHSEEVKLLPPLSLCSIPFAGYGIEQVTFHGKAHLLFENKFDG